MYNYYKVLKRERFCMKCTMSCKLLLTIPAIIVLSIMTICIIFFPIYGAPTFLANYDITNTYIYIIAYITMVIMYTLLILLFMYAVFLGWCLDYKDLKDDINYLNMEIEKMQV